MVGVGWGIEEAMCGVWLPPKALLTVGVKGGHESRVK